MQAAHACAWGELSRLHSSVHACFRVGLGVGLGADRLKEVEHADGKLHLVFEWVDRDLKKHMDTMGGLSMPVIKVCSGTGGPIVQRGQNMAWRHNTWTSHGPHDYAPTD